MTSTGITERLYAKADQDLRKKLEESTAWIWKESGHGANRPSIDDHQQMRHQTEQFINHCTSAVRGGEKIATPWIGNVHQLLIETAFAYLQIPWRDRYVSEFMAKVETMAGEMENLGIIVNQQNEN